MVCIPPLYKRTVYYTVSDNSASSINTTVPNSSINTAVPNSSIESPIPNTAAGQGSSQNHGTGLVKARTMSYTQKLIENGNNSEDENSRKTSVAKPNIKELTNKQRNWFSSFEKSRKESNGNEPIDSVRRSR